MYRHKENIEEGENKGSIQLREFVKHEMLRNSYDQIKIRLKGGEVDQSIYSVGISGGTDKISIGSLRLEK